MSIDRQPLLLNNPTLGKLMGTSPEDNPLNKQARNQDREEFSKAVENFGNLPQASQITTEADKSTIGSETILIVDDTPDNLLVLFSYLEEKGYKVLLAEDGETALQIARSKNPDLILLDVLMPDMNGFETCRRLKEKTATRDIPVIFLTALSETVNKVQGFKLGGVDYITKPSEQEEVLVRIQTHLNLRRMREALAKQNRQQQQALEFEALVRRVTDKLRDSLDESHILESATQELARVLNLGSCQIEFYDSEQVTATIEYEHSITLPSCLGNSRQVKDFPEVYQQLLQKSSVQLVEKIPQFNPQGIQVTRLACPIFDDEGIIGNLWGLKPPGDIFNDAEIRLMQQIANQSAIAIRQARLHKAANQQVDELEKLNQIKDDFLKTISHELKAPMSSIQLAVQTMETLLANNESPHNSPIFQRVIKIFKESCGRQKQLVDDLLTLCYVDAKAKNVKQELIDLKFWLPDLVQLYFNQTQDRQQRLILDLAKEDIQVFADPIILERVVREFLHNALKYTPANETITVQTEANESEISLCVINTGIEIAEEEQELIFNQFYRIPNNDPWKYGGTGLGLTLVQKLATMLNAEVDISSQDRQTVFCIRFPKKEEI